MEYSYQETTFSALGGFDSQSNPGDIQQDPSKVIRMVQTNNVYQPGERYDLMTIPGFAKRRSTTINAAGIFTGGIDFGELASEEVVTVSIAAGSHNLYRNNANPPGALAGGTNFTIGEDNLVDSLLFTDGTNKGAIFLSRLRDLPQFVSSAAARSDFTIAGTGLTSLKPAIGEIFGQRALYADVNRDGTVEDDFIYWSDLRDGNLITSYLNQRESVETKDKDKVRALRRFSEVCVVGKMNHLFLLASNPFATRPFAMREMPLGAGRGPISQQATISTDSACFWLSKHNITSIDASGRIKDWADHLRPTITGLQQDEMPYACAGHLPSQNLIFFSVAASGSTSRNRQIVLNYKTGELFLVTRTRNAYWNYFDSDETLKLSGGGKSGYFYEELTGTTGDADDATALIDADIITPRHRFKQPVLIAGIKVGFDKQGSEAVTVQYRLNDASDWSSFAESPYTVSGTAGEVDEKFFPLMDVGKYAQLRFRDANSGDVMRVQYYTLVWKPITPGLNGLL